MNESISRQDELSTQAVHQVLGALGGIPVAVYNENHRPGYGIRLFGENEIHQEHEFNEPDGNRVRYRLIVNVQVQKEIIGKWRKD